MRENSAISQHVSNANKAICLMKTLKTASMKLQHLHLEPLLIHMESTDTVTETANYVSFRMIILYVLDVLMIFICMKMEAALKRPIALGMRFTSDTSETPILKKKQKIHTTFVSMNSDVRKDMELTGKPMSVRWLMKKISPLLTVLLIISTMILTSTSTGVMSASSDITSETTLMTMTQMSCILPSATPTSGCQWKTISSLTILSETFNQ